MSNLGALDHLMGRFSSPTVSVRRQSSLFWHLTALTKRLWIPPCYYTKEKKNSVHFTGWLLQSFKFWDAMQKESAASMQQGSAANPREETSLENTPAPSKGQPPGTWHFQSKTSWRGRERPAQKEIPGSTVSQAEWCENPIEFPARQVYSPASSKVTFRKYRISSSLSVVLTPAV